MGVMSLFRKQPQSVAPVAAATTDRPTQQQPVQPSQPPIAASSQVPQLFNGGTVDIGAVYNFAKVTSEERDRVVRAEELLMLLPSTASQTREVVDATLRAFGVDARKIIDAASKELGALEAFVRYSHEQTQRVIETNAKRIAELEAEIARCKQVSQVATNEGDERARTINLELVKVQRVLEFFAHDAQGDLDAHDLEDATAVAKPSAIDRKPTANLS